MNNDSNSSKLNASFDAEVHRVAVKLPTFNPDDPALWFAMVERSFEASGVTVETTRFGYVTAMLEPRYAMEVKDIIMNPPTVNPYSRLKEELIKRIGTPSEAKVRQLLEKEEIGDRKPSQFLRRLRDLSNGAVTDSVLRTLWIGRLPQAAQAILVTQKSLDLDRVAELADAIGDVIQPKVCVHEAQAAAAPEAALTLQMAQLTLSFQEGLAAMMREINALKDRQRVRDGQSGGRPSSRSRSRPRSRPRTAPLADTCWYHHIFGAQAKKCKGEGCKFAGNDKAGR